MQKKRVHSIQSNESQIKKNFHFWYNLFYGNKLTLFIFNSCGSSLIHFSTYATIDCLFTMVRSLYA